ncbi:hypothetical protein GQX74_013361 [Glossina fuscipes]|nr:hypothetical protein GQX74_013361 [Glossina fuscipes]
MSETEVYAFTKQESRGPSVHGVTSMGGGSCTSETAAERVARCMAIAAACLRPLAGGEGLKSPSSSERCSSVESCEVVDVRSLLALICCCCLATRAAVVAAAPAAAALALRICLTVVGILATVAEILAFAVAALASKAAAVLATTFVSVESSFSLFSASALPSATIFSTTLLKPLGEDLEILRLLRIRWISSTDKECEMEPEPELLPLK